MGRGVQQGAVVLATAVLTVIASDRLLQRAIPVPAPKMEVDDGIAEMRRGAPETLVLGSSQARSFLAIRDELVRRGAAPSSMAIVSVEGGVMGAYDWVLGHRVRPLLDERTGFGARRRETLKRLVLVSEWWDFCSYEGNDPPNLPGRAWTLVDYVRDVVRHGVTVFNDNYVYFHFQRTFPASILVQDRGLGRVREMLGDLVPSFRARAQTRAVEHDAAFLANWRATVERGYARRECRSDLQRAAFERIRRFAVDRGLDLTVVLFPQDPSTISVAGRAGTLDRFSAEMAALAERQGFRLVDYTLSTPIAPGDFTRDHEHLVASGDAKLRDWALARELAFLQPSHDAELARPEETGRSMRAEAPR